MSLTKVQLPQLYPNSTSCSWPLVPWSSGYNASPKTFCWISSESITKVTVWRLFTKWYPPVPRSQQSHLQLWWVCYDCFITKKLNLWFLFMCCYETCRKYVWIGMLCFLSLFYLLCFILLCVAEVVYTGVSFAIFVTRGCRIDHRK